MRDFRRSFEPDSSFVTWIGYDEEREILALDLRRGSRIEYGDVPLATYLVLRREDEDPNGSVGAYYNSYIKTTFVAPEEGD